MDFIKRLLNRYFPFWIFTFGLIILLTLPVLVQDGMFMDAVHYTSVAHNLSRGIGTFWFLQFSKYNVAGLPSFHEQPPLGFGIESVFFRMLGDSLYVERFYTFLTMVITIGLIIFLWRKILSYDAPLKKTGWLPLIFWISMPLCFWSYSNNMLENTMGVFTLASVTMMYTSFHSGKNKFFRWILSGVFIFCATLTKGIPGFFPLAIPLLYWITVRKVSFAEVIKSSAVIFFTLFILYGVLFLMPESRESLSVYLFKRVLFRIQENPTAENHFWILQRLCLELPFPIILFTTGFAISKFNRRNIFHSPLLRQSVFFFAVGLAASVPLALTLVQKGFYLVPSLPFFAIGFALLLASSLNEQIEKIDVGSKYFRVGLVLTIFLFLFSSGFTFSKIGKTGRSKEMLHDVYLIEKTVPKFSVMSVTSELFNNWNLQCYLMRYCTISLDPVSKDNPYFLTEKNQPIDSTLSYKKMNLETWRFDVYKKE